MSRLVTSGGEIRDHPTTDIGSPDGYAAGSILRATDTSNVRSGQASFLYAGTSGGDCYSIRPFTAPASGTSLFPRVYHWTDALPASTVRIGAFRTAADGALISVRLTSAGKLQLWDDVAAAQIGSDSTLTVEIDRIYRWQLRLLIGAGATDEAELLARVDDYQDSDEQVAVATGLSLSDTHAARLLDGWIDAPGLTANLRADDVAVNSSAGTDHNSWPGDGRNVVLVPLQASATGVGSWTDCSGAASPWSGLDKRPPVGQADHVTAGHTGASAHQARVAANTSQTMQLKTQTWAAGGLMAPTGYDVGAPGGAVGTSYIGFSAASTRRAMSFKFGASVAIDSAMVVVGKVGSPTDNLLVQIQGDASGAPDGTALASGSVTGTSLGLSGVTTYINLDQTLALTPGTTYWLVLSHSGGIDTANYYFWSKSASTDNVPELTPSVYNGTSWVQSGINWNAGEHMFRITPTQGYWPPTWVTQIICHGEGTTGVKAGAMDAATGVTVALAQKTFNFGDNAGVAGTYPTNWRWAIGAGARARPLPTGAAPTITINKASGSGTNPCMACFAGLLVEFTLPPVGWSQWTKNSDSTVWWAKQAILNTTYETGTDGTTVVLVTAGDWAIYPDPQIADGENFPTTLTSITDDSLRSSYTPA